MRNVWERWLLVVAVQLVSVSCKDVTITKLNGTFESPLTVNLTDANEYVLIYPEPSQTDRPYTVNAWSPESQTYNKTILLVAKHAGHVNSWTIPDKLSCNNKTQFYFNTSRTLCSLGSDDEGFTTNPVVILSTASQVNVSVTVTLYMVKDFAMHMRQNYNLSISPSQSTYRFFTFPDNASDTALIRVTSSRNVCLVLRIQPKVCPILDFNTNVKYSGIYQTINGTGAITLEKKSYPQGLFLVFVENPDITACGRISKVPIINSRPGNIITMLEFSIDDSTTKAEYVMVTSITMVIITVLGLLTTGGVILCHKYGSNRHSYVQLNAEEGNAAENGADRAVHDFATDRQRIHEKSNAFLLSTVNAALFYIIPAMQLVLTYQRIINGTGSQDVCYYNFLCAHPLIGDFWIMHISDFNHVFSNIGYVMLALFFMAAVLHRQRRVPHPDDLGIPPHYGLFYAMGAAMISEALLSACYHICPSQSDFQFDTSFMYVIAILIMVKLYENRHSDINAQAHTTFTVAGIAVLFAMLGILSDHPFVWIIFVVSYVIFFIMLSVNVYYFAEWKEGFSNLYTNFRAYHIRDTIRPRDPKRFVVLCIAQVVNFSILVTMLYYYFNHQGNFGTYLLALLMGNTILHIVFYSIMKLVTKEKICGEAICFGILAAGFLITAVLFYFDAATEWQVSPSESRQHNQECIVAGFYDRHDVWHFLSGTGLYYTFLYLMFLDDDLMQKPTNTITNIF